MKVIELKPFEPVAGTEWLAAHYPGVGAYVSSSGQIYIVNNGTVFGIPSASNLVKDIAEPGPIAAEIGNAGGSVSELTLLKALAIAQNPELARDLTK